MTESQKKAWMWILIAVAGLAVLGVLIYLVGTFLGLFGVAGSAALGTAILKAHEQVQEKKKKANEEAEQSLNDIRKKKEFRSKEIDRNAADVVRRLQREKKEKTPTQLMDELDKELNDANQL
jgi:outer membrane PBP1 activator LpoA protein